MIHVTVQVPALFTPLQTKVLQDNAGVINVTYTKLFINLLSKNVEFGITSKFSRNESKNMIKHKMQYKQDNKIN